MNNILSDKIDFHNMQQVAIPVFMACDNNYVPFLSTTIISILEHTKSIINFYVLSDKISHLNKNMIFNLQMKYHKCSIEFIDIDTEIFKDFPVTETIPEIMYCRYLIPQIKTDIKKAVYTDIDVIFNGDISLLYNESLDNFPVGAVKNFIDVENKDFKIKHYKDLELAENHEFFWSGLLLLDCEKLRELNAANLLIDTTKKYSNVLIWPDLDVYNKVFENNYKQLNDKYCFIPQFYLKMLQMGGEYATAAKNPFIYHYAELKPWLYKKTIFDKPFWKYAKESPFYKRIKRIYEKSKPQLPPFEYSGKLLYILLSQNYSKIKLLNFLTIYKKKVRNNKKIFYILGFIPVFAKQTEEVEDD